MIKHAMLISFLVGLIACGGQDSSRNEATHRHEPVCSTAFEIVNAVIRETIPCSDEQEDKQSNCQYLTVGFDKKIHAKAAHATRILVIDKGMRRPAYTRYKSRVLDDLEPDNAGIYRSVNRPVELRRGEFKILSEILDEQFPETSAVSLNDLAVEYRRTFPNRRYWAEHGDAILGTIADLNPKSELLIAQIPSLKQLDFCDLENLKQYFHNASTSLVKSIRQHEVSLVNMSFGHSHETISEYMSQCPRLVPQALRLIQENFYGPLFALKNVTFVQAAATSAHPKTHPIDCAEYPNRIRAGYREQLESDISENGEKLRQRSCVDVLINTGVKFEDELIQGPYPYYMTTTGIGAAPIMMPFQTSWAAPLLLSYLNYNKKRGLMVSKNILIDPFKHKQFERFL